MYNTFPVVEEVSQEELDDQEESKFDRTMSNFDKYFLPRLNVTYERHQFFTRSQLSEETIEQYVTELRKLEKTCEFGVIGESLIRDRLICGVQDVKLKERIDLTLDKALSISRAAEVSKIQVKGLEGTLGSEVKEMDTCTI